MRCGLPDDLTLSVFLPLIGLLTGASTIIAVLNNLRNGRDWGKVSLQWEDMTPSDRRWTTVSLTMLLSTFLVMGVYTLITDALEWAAAQLGWCEQSANSPAMWPPTVVFGFLAMACWVILLFLKRDHPFRASAASAAWGFLSLSVGFGVSVFSDDPAVLVWPAVVATLVPVALIALKQVQR